VVTFHKLIKDSNFIYFIMELIEGEDLFDVITKVVSFTAEHARQLVAQVLLTYDNFGDRMQHANARNAFLELLRLGGAGLDTQSWLLYEKELGKANYALHWTAVARPSNILLAGTPEQRERYLMPCIRGETWDCLAMTEPGAGSDLRGMKATARQEGGDWVLNGTKHFISHADVAGFTFVFMASGEEETPRERIEIGHEDE
jgi:hypothetical protein